MPRYTSGHLRKEPPKVSTQQPSAPDLKISALHKKFHRMRLSVTKQTICKTWKTKSFLLVGKHYLEGLPWWRYKTSMEIQFEAAKLFIFVWHSPCRIDFIAGRTGMDRVASAVENGSRGWEWQERLLNSPPWRLEHLLGKIGMIARWWRWSLLKWPRSFCKVPDVRQSWTFHR